MTDGTMGLSAADVAAVTRNNDDDWGGGCWWIWIILLAFLFPMMGGWNRGGVETGVQDNFISDEFVKRDIFNTNQNVPTLLARHRGTYWKIVTPISSAYSRYRRHSRIVAAKRRKKSCRAGMMRHSWHRICRRRWHSVAATSKRAFWPMETQPDR